MKDISHLWEPILDDFKRDHPELISRIVEWGPYSDTEVVVELDDDTHYIYDSTDGGVRPYFESRRLITDASEQDWRDNFALRLRHRLHRKNMTSEELSDITGISRITISKYTNGKATPSMYNAEKIADALGVYLRDLTVFKKERRD